jgi:hypothetical protein
VTAPRDLAVFELDGGAGLVAGVNVPTRERPPTCAHALTFAHAVDLLLAAEADAKRSVERARLVLLDQVSDGSLHGLAAYQDARARLSAVRECASFLMRHEQEHHADGGAS